MRLTSTPARLKAQVLSIELGTTTSKAVHLVRAKGKIETAGHVVCDSPLDGSDVSPAVLAAHFRKLAHGVRYKGKDIVVALPMREALLQSMLMPDVPSAELRQILKLSGRKYFHQEVGDYTFDLLATPAAERGIGGQPPRIRPQKNVVVAAAKHELVRRVQAAARMARLRLQAVTINQLGSVHAMHLAMPDSLHNRAMVLLDFGFNCASISLLVNGQPAMTRVINIDGERLSRGLAESYRVSANVPAEFKMEMIRSRMREQLAPLADEFRAAIQFFEAEYDCQIPSGVITGDLAESDLLVETLQLLEVPCERLKVRDECVVSFPVDDAASGVAKRLPQFMSAAGAGANWLLSAGGLNLLAEFHEEVDARRRDPVRRTIMLAALLVAALAILALEIRWRNARAETALARLEPRRQQFSALSQAASVLMRKTSEVEAVAGALRQHATNRFLFGPVLNGLQETAADQVQLVKLTIQERMVHVESVPAATNNGVVVPRKPATSTQAATLTLMAKNLGEADARERFIEQVQSSSFFKQALRKENAVILKSQLPRQADPLEPSRSFSLFTIECAFPEKVVGHD